MRAGKIVNIECKCGVLLFRYYKAGKGKIIRCYIKRMEKDFVGGWQSAEPPQAIMSQLPKRVGNHYDDQRGSSSEAQSRHDKGMRV